MKERPILFSAPMVRAILDGRKTQTRRAYKNRKHPDFGCDIAASELVREAQHVIDRACPYGQPGDRLWVRETWSSDDGKTAWYRADGETYNAGLPWRPSIFMPRWASRITLEITGVRVERLNEISTEDAIAEGTPVTWGDWRGQAPEWALRSIGPEYGSPGSHLWDNRTTVKNYGLLWESINGAGSWAANPWVWCIEFKRL